MCRGHVLMHAVWMWGGGGGLSGFQCRIQGCIRPADSNSVWHEESGTLGVRERETSGDCGRRQSYIRSIP